MPKTNSATTQILRNTINVVIMNEHTRIINSMAKLCLKVYKCSHINIVKKDTGNRKIYDS